MFFYREMYDANNFGLNDDYDYHEICIDSRDATAAFKGAYTSLNWPNITLGKELDNVAAIKVLQVVVPKTYYPVNSTNGTFDFWSYFATDTPRWTNRATATGLVLTPGAYTTTTLAAEIKRVMDASWTPTVTFTPVSFSDTTGKLSIVSSLSTASNRYLLIANRLTNVTTQTASQWDFPADIQSFAQINNNARDNPRLIMGFEGGAGTAVSGTITGLTRGPNFSTGGTTSSKIFTSPFTNQINGPPYLYLNSSVLGSMINVYLNGMGHMDPAGSGSDGPQIAKIPVGKTAQWRNIVYSDPDPQKWFFIGNVDFPTSFDFYLTDGVSSEQIPLDLNGESFIVKLGILTNRRQVDIDYSSIASNDRVVRTVRTK